MWAQLLSKHHRHGQGKRNWNRYMEICVWRHIYNTFLVLEHGANLFWSLRVSTVSRHYFQYISLVETRWRLFSRQRGSPLCVFAASAAKSEFMLLWVDLFNYCRADLQSHLPEIYLANSFDTWLCLHPFRSKKLFELLMHVYTLILFVLHSIYKACDNLHMRGRTSKSARNILNDVRTTTLSSFTLTFASNCDCRMVFKNKIPRLLKTEN